jgi:hypothetical protein
LRIPIQNFEASAKQMEPIRRVMIGGLTLGGDPDADDG